MPIACPKASRCKLYQNRILQGHAKDNVYKIIYCESERYRDCVRYQTYRKTGTCPDFIMPNSKHDLEYILKKIEEGDTSASLSDSMR